MIKGTTNIVTVIVIVVTAFIAVAALFFPVNAIDPVITGLWGSIVGWVIGAKSNKSKAVVDNTISENKVNKEDVLKLIAQSTES